MAQALSGLQLFSTIFGIVNGAIGLATTPVFMTSATFGVNDHMLKFPAAGIRMYAGMSHPKDTLGCRTPSVAMFNVNGQFLGSSGKSHHTIPQGNYQDIAVKFRGSNEPPDYMAIAA